MPRPFLWVALASLVFALSGCTSAKKESAGEDGVVSVEKQDPEMVLAIETARRTFDDFLAKLAAATKPGSKTAKSEFAIKVGMKTANDSTEHIWVKDVRQVGAKLKGNLANHPLNIEGKKLGDPVEFTREQVSDWMIRTEDGKIEGGFTNKVLEKYEAQDPEPEPK